MMSLEEKYPWEEIRSNREATPPVTWRVLTEMYGAPSVSGFRGQYSRWLRTQKGEKAPKYKAPPPAYVTGEHLVVESRKDNTYLFGVAGDRHHGSKYHRNDVLQDLHERFKEAGVDLILDTGNWIDGEARFNRHDLVRVGMTPQLTLMAEETPRIGVPTYAIWGDDHEGWYAAREGINIGEYAESVMRKAGHKWHNLGYMEAYVVLRNTNSGVETLLSVMHPGGGSAYALSYRPQKIVESLEGGEKPSVIVMGHYHKMEALNVRNVWVLQSGTCQDQTPFLRKKSIAAHIGGVILGMEQDPKSGAIVGFSPAMKRYFNLGFYNERWSRHGAVLRPRRTTVPSKGLGV
jgi:predicted phosphodiesterase